MRNMLPKLIITTLAAAAFLAVPWQALAASSLSLSPSSITKTWPYRTFSVQVLESSGTTAINAVLANLNYPTAMLTCLSISAPTSGFFIPGSYDPSVNFGKLTSCGSGTITIVEGATGNGVSGNNNLVATINLKVNSTASAGSAAVSFSTTSPSALVKSPGNTNDLSSSSGGTYTICKMIDLNCDTFVDINDVGAFGLAWQTKATLDDINGDNTVDVNDVGAFGLAWQTK